MFIQTSIELLFPRFLNRHTAVFEVRRVFLMENTNVSDLL